MRITIADRLRPFSHEPGIGCVLPLTSLRFQIFPAFIKIFDLSASCPQSIEQIKVDIEGPVRDFTVQQSLEECTIKVWGHSKHGFYRYLIQSTESGKRFFIRTEKQPLDNPIIHSNEGESPILRPSIENLSFGISKSQDCNLVHRRQSLQEILPFWFRLGQLVPQSTPHYEGTAALLKPIEEAIADKNYQELTESLLSLYLTGFEGMFCPRLLDDQYQGVNTPLVKMNSASPLVLLTEGAKLIRKMLVDHSEHQVSILPCLLPELHCGRMTGIALGPLGTLDLEWSKKTIRRMIFRCQKDGEVRFNFAKDSKRYRLRKGEERKGQIQECGLPVCFYAGADYLFDNFEK